MAEAEPAEVHRPAGTDATAPGPPWPTSALVDGRGLTLAGVPASELADLFGTPLVVIDEDELRSRCRAARELFPSVWYAVKAFTASAALRIALDEGLDLLAATGGEVEACLRAGAPPGRVAFHGNAKTDEELCMALEAGIGLLVADGSAELRRIDRLARTRGRVQPVFLRVAPDVEVATHEAIATGHDASKFGTALADAPAVLEEAATMPGLRVDGVHAHIGSQLLDVEPYLRTMDVLVALIDEVRGRSGLTLRALDVGGGFGVRYVDEEPPDLDLVAAALTQRLTAACRARDLEVPTLVVEPGRWLIANAGVTLYRVIAAKTVAGGRRLLAVDGGMSDNVRPALYDARYRVAPASRSRERDEDEEAFTVVGRHCESGDTLAERVGLPSSTGPGDLLAFAATGAYTYSLASTYNRVGRPAVVAVSEGVPRLWLRREDAADLDRLEAGAARRVEAPSIEGVHVRPARPGDAGSYLAFWTAIVEEGRHVRTERVTNSARVYRRRFRTPWTDREAQIVAVDDAERVIGHLYIQREGHPVTHHVATLGIAVAAEARGRGVGTALMAEAIRWARSVGVDKIVLSVYPGNARAIALYRRFGFVEEGRLARHSRKSYGDEDEILMAAWLGDDAVRPGGA
jgi:diaminopimelate decarboxylase